MNIIPRLEFELAYYDFAAPRFTHYTTNTPHFDIRVENESYVAPVEGCHTHTHTHTNIYIYIYIYIYIPSSSSCRAASTDIPDPLSPLLPIVHHLWQVFRATQGNLVQSQTLWASVKLRTYSHAVFVCLSLVYCCKGHTQSFNVHFHLRLVTRKLKNYQFLIIWISINFGVM